MLAIGKMIEGIRPKKSIMFIETIIMYCSTGFSLDIFFAKSLNDFMGQPLIKTAVIGLGNMGRHHVRNYAESQHCELVAVCDPQFDKTSAFADKYNCRAYASLDDMFENSTIDAVSIVAPTRYHFDIASDVINRGIHVLIEKPIADLVEDADVLTQMAKKNNVVLMVGHIERFNPAVTALKDLVDDGVIGDVTSLISRRVGVFPSQIKDANVVIDLAVHDIDIFSYIIGCQPDSIKGNAGRALITDREDYADIFLTYGNRSGFIQVNWITPVRIRTLAVTGKNGYAELNYLTSELSLYRSHINKENDPNGDAIIHFGSTEKELIDVPKTEPLSNEIHHFLECINHKKTPLISGETGRDALKIALDVLSHFKTS